MFFFHSKLVIETEAFNVKYQTLTWTDEAEDLACALMANAEEVFRLALSECRAGPGRSHPFAATCLSNLADCARWVLVAVVRGRGWGLVVLVMVPARGERCRSGQRRGPAAPGDNNVLSPDHNSVRISINSNIPGTKMDIPQWLCWLW